MNQVITGQIEIKKESFKKISSSIKNIKALEKEVEKSLSKEVTQVLEIILGGAITLDASDIHIEPEEQRVKLRVRLDGVLHDVIFFERKTFQALLQRIKLLSGIKLNITEKAQDGRFTILLANEQQIEMRTSTLPSEYGESVVMRILNPKSLIEIEGLGIREDIMEVFKKEIKRPHGMIIVTGPTGSGKTTTLYAILKRIKSEELKIITIEDPIEYRIEGISQSQVNPQKGYDFATGLRAIVRQDPDVILVGEIRDLETASIALQAALTGHLVLSTLHTNDAAGTVARLQSLGENPVNIAPAINLTIAQRLVRRICKKCSSALPVKEEELKVFKKELSYLSKKIKIPPITKTLKIPKSKGCNLCNFTGYKGRVGVYEFFLVNDEIESFILKSPAISELREKAKKSGMVTMKQDGLIKVLQGVTTLEEIERVMGE